MAGAHLQETPQEGPRPVGRLVCPKDRIRGRGGVQGQLREARGMLGEAGRPQVGRHPKV